MNDEYSEDTFTDEDNANIKETANEIRKKVARKGRPKKAPVEKPPPLKKEEPVIKDLEKYQKEYYFQVEQL